MSYPNRVDILRLRLLLSSTGNHRGLSTELLENLVKMAPTKEEEIKLVNYKDDVSKLDSAERFLKSLLDIPFAFKRVDAMVYRANFESEIKYLMQTFETLEVIVDEKLLSYIDFKIHRFYLIKIHHVLMNKNPRCPFGNWRLETHHFFICQTNFWCQCPAPMILLKYTVKTCMFK